VIGAILKRLTSPKRPIPPPNTRRIDVMRMFEALSYKVENNPEGLTYKSEHDRITFTKNGVSFSIIAPDYLAPVFIRITVDGEMLAYGRGWLAEGPWVRDVDEYIEGIEREEKETEQQKLTELNEKYRGVTL